MGLKTGRLSIVKLAPGGQENAEVAVNAIFELADVVIQGDVLDRTNTPPTGVDGKTYIITASPTGVWSGFAEHDLVFYYSGWRTVTPQKGWRMYVSDEDVWVTFSGTAWVISSMGRRQAAGIALTDSTTGTDTDALADVGSSYSQSTLNDNNAGLAQDIITLRSKMISAGLMS